MSRPFFVKRSRTDWKARGVCPSSAMAAGLEKVARPRASCESMNSWRLLIPHLYTKNDKNQLISDMNRGCCNRKYQSRFVLPYPSACTTLPSPDASLYNSRLCVPIPSPPSLAWQGPNQWAAAVWPSLALGAAAAYNELHPCKISPRPCWRPGGTHCRPPDPRLASLCCRETP